MFLYRIGYDYKLIKQPQLYLTNSKESENLTEFEILNKTPLSYFIRKSLTSQYE